MSLYLDEKYLKLLAPTLARFTPRPPHTYNFRCPFCGDSATDKLKARCYMFPVKTQLMMKCHNCGLALPFPAVLRRLNRSMYDEYTMEAFRDSQPISHTPPQPPPKPVRIASGTSDPRSGIFPLSSATDPSHSVYAVLAYIRDRGIPQSAWSRLFGTVLAQTWARQYVGVEKAKRLKDGEPYLVLPLRTTDGTWYGAQFRRIAAKEFVTYRWEHDPLKIFGLEQIDPTQPVYVVESPLDSVFLPNAVAACGSDLDSAWMFAASEFSVAPEPVFVWDNEPRNKEIVKHLKNAIALGWKVVIWPSGLGKDLNDMANAGVDVVKLVKSRIFSGLHAELEFSVWQK